MNLITRRYIALDRYGMGGTGRSSGAGARRLLFLLHSIEYLVFYAIGLAVLTVVVLLLAGRWLMKVEQ